jgi:AcrR family transcriptional regulator
VPRTARERARAEITREITEAARRHLAIDGAAALSLRAIARDLGMASSAVYRYVASRDDLLTRLIIEAYDSLGAAAEKAEATQDRQVGRDLHSRQDMGDREPQRVRADLRLSRTRIRSAGRHDRASEPRI